MSVEELARPEFEAGISVARQITNHVRNLIQTGELSPGSRVPSMRSLASFWGSNYFTVQAAMKPLVAEGLLVQSPKLGTFVAITPRKLERACIYHGNTLDGATIPEFYPRLDLHLYKQLSERGVTTISYFDHRPMARHGKIPPKMDDWIKTREIDAVISLWHHHEAYSWLVHLPLPWATPGVLPHGGHIGLDRKAFFAQAVETMKSYGRRRPAFITQIQEADMGGLNQSFTDALSREGMQQVPITKSGGNPEDFGFQVCRDLISGDTIPDTILVHTDTMCRGVIAALNESNLKVPEDILLISHRNREVPIFSSFPVVWLSVSIEDWAKAMIRQLERQVAGKKAIREFVPIVPEYSPGYLEKP